MSKMSENQIYALPCCLTLKRFRVFKRSVSRSRMNLIIKAPNVTRRIFLSPCTCLHDSLSLTGKQSALFSLSRCFNSAVSYRKPSKRTAERAQSKPDLPVMRSSSKQTHAVHQQSSNVDDTDNAAVSNDRNMVMIN